MRDVNLDYVTQLEVENGPLTGTFLISRDGERENFSVEP